MTEKNGLRWRQRKDGTQVGYWIAAKPFAKEGYSLRTQRLWSGVDPSVSERRWIESECARLQAEMLDWKERKASAARFSGTVTSLSRCYQSDPDSPFHDLRFSTRKTYVKDLVLIERTVGSRELAKLVGNDFRRWYKKWREPKGDSKPRTRLAHGAIVMFKILVNWGATMEYPHCRRLAEILSKARFEAPGGRKDRLTWFQAEAIVSHALDHGRPSIALAQALQADCAMRQKDVIGEWVPIAEPGISDIVWGDKKWLRGLRWEMIDATLSFAHVTSKRGTIVTHDLTASPLVMRVLDHMAGRKDGGPLVVSEKTGRPYRQRAFAEEWREIADGVGVPREVWNMDSRAGAITEGSDAGAELEHLRQTAGHSSTAITSQYNRSSVQKSRTVSELRKAYRDNGNRRKT